MVIGYMDKTDFDDELGYASDGNILQRLHYVASVQIACINAVLLK
jgi:hypothetical protein